MLLHGSEAWTITEAEQKGAEQKAEYHVDWENQQRRISEKSQTWKKHYELYEKGLIYWIDFEILAYLKRRWREMRLERSKVTT
jgi:hypothetical protein